MPKYQYVYPDKTRGFGCSVVSDLDRNPDEEMKYAEEFAQKIKRDIIVLIADDDERTYVGTAFYLGGKSDEEHDCTDDCFDYDCQDEYDDPVGGLAYTAEPLSYATLAPSTRVAEIIEAYKLGLQDA